MADDKPSHTDRDDRDMPSRFPELFPNLEAENWVAAMLCHDIEDGLMLGDPVEPEGRQYGIISQGVRYVDVFRPSRARATHRQWLIEPQGNHYWRIVLATGLDDGSYGSRFMAVRGVCHVWDFLADHVVHGKKEVSKLMPRPDGPPPVPKPQTRPKTLLRLLRRNTSGRTSHAP